MISLLVSGLVLVCPVVQTDMHQVRKSLLRIVCFILEMSVQVDTEKQFDNEFDLESTVQYIVDKAKAEVKSKYGNKKRHRQ